MGDYYLQIWYSPVASEVTDRLNIDDLRKLGNIRKVSQIYNDSLVPSLTIKMKMLLILAENSRKTEIKLFPLCAISY